MIFSQGISLIVNRFCHDAGRFSSEPVLDAAQIIIDAHHHLYDRPGNRYLYQEMLEDSLRGHDVRATVFVQARHAYLTTGPEHLRAAGETEYAAQTAAACDSGCSGLPRICEAIVAHADLTLGDSVCSVLEAHIQAGSGRFKGIRMPLTWDQDASLLNPAYPTSSSLMQDKRFLQGFARLKNYGLSFDAWLFFHQIEQLVNLARKFSDTPIVLNHCGGILGTGKYRDRHSDVRNAWLSAIKKLSICENVMVKLGGLGMPLSGLGFDASPRSPDSVELANAWSPWFEPLIEIFGPSRCMFESNFPADKISYDYVTCWNAMKRITKEASQEEKDALFWKSAADFYKIDMGEPGTKHIPFARGSGSS